LANKLPKPFFVGSVLLRLTFLANHDKNVQWVDKVVNPYGRRETSCEMFVVRA
jgi:hypothetical protein